MARTTSAAENLGERVFRRAVLCFGLAVAAIAAVLAFRLFEDSRQAWAAFGLRFLWSSAWDPVGESFGALPFIFGTLYSSLLALLIAVPLGTGAAVFLAELAPRRLSDACAFLIELLAAIPSVALGLMGIFVLVPRVREAEHWLRGRLDFLPLFRGEAYGVGMLAASLILSIMILPFITSMAREALLSVPRPLKEAYLALGSTHWEMVRSVSLPYSRSVIIGGVFLALGRALGETMAVTMVIGNTPKMSWSLLDPGATMASLLANEFAEASSDMHLNALMAIGLSLFLITVAVNGAARLAIRRAGKGP
jgi:phosphate transport system permease protein